jgi:hypothetical protein
VACRRRLEEEEIMGENGDHESIEKDLRWVVYGYLVSVGQ